MFSFSEDLGADLFLKCALVIVLFTGIGAGGSRVFEYFEARSAMQNGYEQVVDPSTNRTLWKKASE